MKLTRVKQWWALTPAPQKKVLIIVLFVAVTLMGFFILRPLYKAGTKNFQKAEALREEVRKLHEISKTIDLKEKSAKNELKEIERIVTENSLHNSILPVFSTNFASKHGDIEFLGIKPGKQQKAGKRDGKKVPPYIPLDVVFRSDYATIIEYLNYVESLPSPLKINSMLIAMDEDVEGLLKTTVKLYLYVHENNKSVLIEEPLNVVSRSLSSDSDQGELTFAPKGAQIEGGGGELKDISLSLTGFIGEKALFGENLYDVGDTIQGWRINEISSFDGKVVLVRGEKKKIISIGE